MIFGGGAGEGLAAVRGHQSGDEGIRAVMPAFSLGDQNDLGSYDSASRHRLHFIFGRSKLRISRCGGRGATALPRDVRKCRGERFNLRKDV